MTGSVLELWESRSEPAGPVRPPSVHRGTGETATGLATWITGIRRWRIAWLATVRWPANEL